MPCKGPKNIRRDDWPLVVGGNTASLVLYALGELIYAVINVLKPQKRGFENVRRQAKPILLS